MNRKKTIIVSVTVIVGLGLISTLVALMSSGTAQTAPDPKQQTTESQLKYLASKEFGNLPNKAKGKYVKSLDRGKLFQSSRKMSTEDKKQLRSNIGSVFRAMMQERVNKYSQLTTKEAKSAYLDEMIDKMTNFRKARNKTMTSEDKKKWEERRAKRGNRTRSLDRIKNRIETSDPKERAQRTEFFIDMRARMKERGITPHRRWGK